jgi:hypothetical protein
VGKKSAAKYSRQEHCKKNVTVDESIADSDTARKVQWSATVAESIADDGTAREVQWSATVAEPIADDDTARDVQWSATVAKSIADRDTAREVQWSATAAIVLSELTADGDDVVRSDGDDVSHGERYGQLWQTESVRKACMTLKCEKIMMFRSSESI